jgi:L-lactate dehydrogenase complex protein LldF
LCGSCTDVCPVKIDIHDQLFAWRQEETAAGVQPLSKSIIMRFTGIVLGRPRVYRLASRVMRYMLQRGPRAFVYNRWNVWTRQRELPEVPDESFREWYLRTGGNADE